MRGPRSSRLAIGDRVAGAKAAALAHLALGRDDLLRDPTYRRLWTSVLTSAFGAQIMLLALPLTAAVSLHASPTQMGLLTAMEVLPFTLFSLPAGVWLDRVRKLPVYITGELTLAGAAASVPLVGWLGLLSITWLCGVAFVIGTVGTTAGQRRADRADAGGDARSADRGERQERAGFVGRRSGRPGRRRRADQAGRRADRAVVQCRAAADVRGHSERYPHRRAAAARRRPVLAGTEGGRPLRV